VKAITHSPCSRFSVRTAAKPYALASVCRINRRSKSGQTKTGAVVSVFFSHSKAFFFAGPDEPGIFLREPR